MQRKSKNNENKPNNIKSNTKIEKQNVGNDPLLSNLLEKAKGMENKSIDLSLELYEKAYQMINENSSLKKKIENKILILKRNREYKTPLNTKKNSLTLNPIPPTRNLIKNTNLITPLKTFTQIKTPHTSKMSRVLPPPSTVKKAPPQDPSQILSLSKIGQFDPRKTIKTENGMMKITSWLLNGKEKKRKKIKFF